MMFYDQQEVARQRTQERIDNGLRRARHLNNDDETDGGARHRMAVALRRMADRLEPPAPRRTTTLSFSGR